MKLYAGIDLHSTNSVIVVQDEDGKIIKRARLANELETILAWLHPYRDALVGAVVESTYNWYWLVDGLQHYGYVVHLANTAAIQQYEGLKYGDDDSDALWLGTLLRLGVLPEGYIYPKEERPVRDLMRKRSQMVRIQTQNILSIENLITRNTGGRVSANDVRKLTPQVVDKWLPEEDLALAVKCNVAVLATLREQIDILEKTLKDRVKLRQEFKGLLTVDGIGLVLALTIMLETGEISRFARVGNYVSYCRCVNSTRLSNGKKKGSGNAKNGNKYLAWAFVEAAQHAIRHNKAIKKFYTRKTAKVKRVVAIKAVAHKLARACYHIIRDGVVFDQSKAFG